MAICPFATKKLIPAGANDPEITPRAVILHVDAGNAESLFEFFKDRSGGVESHFHVKKTGEIEQYRDTAFQADANLDANDFAISIETQGFANETWNAFQLASIRRLLVWCRDTHDILLRKIQEWNGSGVGYHTLFGAPSHWTPVAKTCPGPLRIKQFEDNIVPWLNQMSTPKTPQVSQPAEFITAFNNLDFGRSWLKHRQTLTKIMQTKIHGRVPDIIGVSELRRFVKVLLKLNWRVIQSEGSVDRPGSEAILIRRKSKLKILGAGYVRASVNSFKQDIGERTYVWCVSDNIGFPNPVGTIIVHFPPLRMQDSQLDEAYDDTLQELIIRLQLDFDCDIQVLGDWNERPGTDPAHLKKVFNMKWYFDRIDLAALSSKLVNRVILTKAIQEEGRSDNHPAIYIAYR